MTLVKFTPKRRRAQDAVKKFAIIAKQPNNPFFDPAVQGCLDEAARRSSEAGAAVLECIDKTPEEQQTTAEYAYAQAQIIFDLIEQGDFDGISLSVVDADVVSPAIATAVQAGVPVITFDSDAPNSKRLAYVGTNNYEMGQSLGKIVQQLKPTGGIYGLISDTPPNLVERERGFRDYMIDYPQWREDTVYSPTLSQDSIDISLDQCEQYAKLQPNIDAIVPTGGWPMFDSNTTRWVNFVDNNPNLTLVVADTLDIQYDLLMAGKADGLVGQVPYQMGVDSVTVLDQITSNITVNDTNLITVKMEFVRVPLILPPVNIDHNYLGSLCILGYVFFGIIVLTALACIGWTWKKRKVRVVKASQPLFLIMIAIGALVLGSSLIPLSYEDQDVTFFTSSERANRNCMAVPWLGCIGFAMSFSALFAKTWRINRIFNSRKGSYARVTVKERDVMVPFVLIVSANVIILVCWTLLAPLEYQRKNHSGVDLWGRPVSTYGACRSEESSIPYLVSLTVVNVGLLIVANLQAYQARTIQSEFAESSYISVVMVSLLQAGLTGLPILFLVRENPQAFYLVLVFMVTVISLAILLLIFVPKIIYERKYQNMTASQRKAGFRAALQGSRPVQGSRPAENKSSRSSKMASIWKSLSSGKRSTNNSTNENIPATVDEELQAHTETAMESSRYELDTEGRMEVDTSEEFRGSRADDEMIFRRTKSVVVKLGRMEDDEEKGEPVNSSQVSANSRGIDTSQRSAASKVAASQRSANSRGIDTSQRSTASKAAASQVSANSQGIDTSQRSAASKAAASQRSTMSPDIDRKEPSSPTSSKKAHFDGATYSI